MAPDNAQWPVRITGVTESIVATSTRDDDWNLAALGLFPGDPVRARTWGDTRTKRNFHRTNRGVIQFIQDPVVFVEAALGILEQDEAVVDGAAAWVTVTVQLVDDGTRNGTRWEAWALRPIESVVAHESVPTITRGFNAVIEASVLASRLDVPGYDTATYEAYIEYLGSVVERCGRPQDRAAFRRLQELAGLGDFT